MSIVSSAGLGPGFADGVWSTLETMLTLDPNGTRWLFFLVVSILGGLVVFFATAVPLHHYFYTRRRDEAERWKIQKSRWLPERLNREAMRMSTLNMILGGACSGTFIEYVASGGWTRIYFNVSDYGVPYLLLSTVFVFLWADWWAYAIHRLFHHPLLYKRFHRMHHRYVATTVYVTVAIHPLELLGQVVSVYSLLFLIPVYVPMFAVMLIYILVYNIIDHSGVNMTSLLTWQPSTRFHDDHHRHFHCNYGQHLTLWDRLGGTLRREKRRYGEDVFGGRGEGRGDEFVRY